MTEVVADDIQQTTTAADPVGSTGRIVTLHPLFVAAFSVVGMWGANAFEVPVEDGWAILVPVLGATVGTWAILSGLMWTLRRDRPIARGGLATTIAAVMVLFGGRLMPGIDSAQAAFGVVVGVAILGLVLAARISGAALGLVAKIVNVFTIVALVMAALPLRPVLLPNRAAPVTLSFEGATVPARDIWYIIPDRYPRADTLEAEFGYDNGPFLEGLIEHGFTIQDQARANYPKTAHSLAATFNLETIQTLVPEAPEDPQDWRPIYDLLEDHQLGRFVTEAGFDYVHLGSWWAPTQNATSATEIRRFSDVTEFEGVWRNTTALRWTGEEPADEGLELRREVFAIDNFQLDELDKLVTEPHDRPRLVLAHMTIPHPPFVFNADGSYVTRQEQDGRSREENFTNMVTYLNSRLATLVDELVTGDPETDPIIVIQSDEGPHPDYDWANADPSAHDWRTAPLEVRTEKLRSLSAWYLPGIDEVPPEDTTGVNTWRFIFDHYFGTDFGPVPDDVWVYDWSDLYTFHDVTDEFD